MAEIKIDLTEYELDEITIDCPYRKPPEPGTYHYGSYGHTHIDGTPEGYPCYGGGRGPGLVSLVRFLADTVAKLDAQLNPPPPKPVPKPKRVQARKVKK